MSYTPTSWATGDVITAEKLNNMEEGIEAAGGGSGGGIEIIDGVWNDDEGYGQVDNGMTKVKNAIVSGKLPVVRLTDSIYEDPEEYGELYFPADFGYSNSSYYIFIKVQLLGPPHNRMDFTNLILNNNDAIELSTYSLSRT